MLLVLLSFRKLKEIWEHCARNQGQRPRNIFYYLTLSGVCSCGLSKDSSVWELNLKLIEQQQNTGWVGACWCSNQSKVAMVLAHGWPDTFTQAFQESVHICLSVFLDILHVVTSLLVPVWFCPLLQRASCSRVAGTCPERLKILILPDPWPCE